jgi:glycosyltransferase
MKVSIITVCKNSASTIRDTILSVGRQTHPEIEYIVIDGLSLDGTIDIISEYKDKITHFVSEGDKGLYFAMNRGISLATGDIVGILNSDDFFAHENVIKNIVHSFENNDIDCVYGDLVYVDRYNPEKISRVWKAGVGSARNFYFGWMPPHPAFFVKRELYHKCGPFDTRFRIASDYELMLRMMVKYSARAIYLPETFTYMRQGGASNNSMQSRLISFKENNDAWKVNQLSPYFFTIFLKIFRKVFQFSNPLRFS